MRYLSVCCIAKDEDLLIKEWLCYHHLLGVEHFYIYDNMSKVPIRELLGDFVSDSQVTVRRVHGEAMQKSVYQNALHDFGPECHWLGFIDVDEFVCPLHDDDLRITLSEYEDYGGLGIAWDMFSSNGHENRPDGLIIENYTRSFTIQAMAKDEHIKSFVQPAKVLDNFNPHVFTYAGDAFCVNEDHLPIPEGCHRTISLRRKVKLNHYFYRSREDFTDKVRRGRADVGKARQRSIDDFDRHLGVETWEDRHILRFAPAVKKLMAAGRLPEQPLYAASRLELYQYTDMAVELIKAGRFEKAFIRLCHAIPFYPRNSELWTMLGLIARNMGNLERAELFLRRALRYEETYHAYNELIALRKAQGRRDDVAQVARFLAAHSTSGS